MVDCELRKFNLPSSEHHSIYLTRIKLISRESPRLASSKYGCRPIPSFVGNLAAELTPPGKVEQVAQRRIATREHFLHTVPTDPLPDSERRKRSFDTLMRSEEEASPTGSW